MVPAVTQGIPAFSSSIFIDLTLVQRYCFTEAQMFSIGLRSGLDGRLAHQLIPHNTLANLMYVWGHCPVGSGVHLDSAFVQMVVESHLEF